MADQPATHPERTSNGVHADGNFCTTRGSPFGGPQCTTTYTEGIYIGYRFYDQQQRTPLYPFGYGLSYTKFAYSGLRATAGDGGLDVSFQVTNTGSVTGAEVPQVYLGARPARLPGWSSPRGHWPPTAGSPCPARPSPSRCTSRCGNCSTGTPSQDPGSPPPDQRPLYIAGNERSTELATTITVPGGGH